MSIEIKHVKEISAGFTESDRSFSMPGRGVEFMPIS